MGLFDRDEADPERGMPGWIDGPADLPLAARHRLARIRDSGMFTSRFSAKEYRLASGSGVQPLAEVLGTAVYHVGWQRLPPEAQWKAETFIFPLRTISDAWAEARRLAFDRLRSEAAIVAADGILGVRLQRAEHDWGRGTVDIRITGTAVRVVGAGQPARGQPVLSDLSVQDHRRLAAAGQQPAGLVTATSVMFVSQSTASRWRRRLTTLSNQELHEFSEGFTAGRRAAVTGLRDTARGLEADGIVGVSLDYEWEHKELAIDLRGVQGSQSTGMSITSVANFDAGALAPTSGDKREGLVFTIHAAGTAIRGGELRGEGDQGTRVSLGLSERRRGEGQGSASRPGVGDLPELAPDHGEGQA